MKKIVFLILITSITLYADIQVAFDIGTGKVKMQVADVNTKQKTLTPLFCQAYRIQNHSFDHLNALLKTLIKKAHLYSPSVLIGIATEKYRKDEIGAILIKQLKQSTGIAIEVIPAEKEAILAHKTVAYETLQDPSQLIVWDIGSGSFQIICYDNGKYITYTSPYGRTPFHEYYLSLLGSEEEKFQHCLRKKMPFLKNVPDSLLKKIRYNQGRILCIGSYPFKDHTSKMKSGQLFINLVKNILDLSLIDYRSVLAGNTTGLLLEYNHF